MAKTPEKVDVYLETGEKRTFAGAIAWPGWCRSGRDAETALQALLDYAPRYAQVMKKGEIEFEPPTTPSAFNIIEQIKGNATTDFGAPDAAPALDSQPVDPAGLNQLQSVMRACWQTFDHITRSAVGKDLRLGPRGGGRQLEKILWHAINAEKAYLSSMGGKIKVDETADPSHEYARLRQEVLDTLARAAAGEIPAQGPRGGQRWSPRYFVRRAAWHVLDHAWEVEDRLIE